MPDTNWLREKELKHRVGIATFTPPTNWYVGLSSTLPTAGGTNVTEPSGNGYARTAVASAGTGWAFTTDEISNAEAIEIGPSSGSWLAGADLTYAVLYDAATTGNLAAYAALADARVVNAGGITVVIAIGELIWRRVNP